MVNVTAKTDADAPSTKIKDSLDLFRYLVEAFHSMFTFFGCNAILMELI